jgi:hypothetical protein
MDTNDQLKMQASVIAAGVIQSHGIAPEDVARVSIAIAHEINRQVDPPDRPPTDSPVPDEAAV